MATLCVAGKRLFNIDLAPQKATHLMPTRFVHINLNLLSIEMHKAFLKHKTDNVRMYWNYRNNRRLMQHWCNAVERGFIKAGKSAYRMDVT